MILAYGILIPSVIFLLVSIYAFNSTNESADRTFYVKVTLITYLSTISSLQYIL